MNESSLGYNNWVFRSGSVGLSFEKPFGNNTARGLLEARRASLRRTQIDSADLERVIAPQRHPAGRVAQGRRRPSPVGEEAVRNYDQTMTNEQARFKSGDSSLLDTILTEQQTTSARLAYIAAQQEYASLLAQLRHEAGLLVQDGNVDGVAARRGAPGAHSEVSDGRPPDDSPRAARRGPWPRAPLRPRRRRRRPPPRRSASLMPCGSRSRRRGSSSSRART